MGTESPATDGEDTKPVVKNENKLGGRHNKIATSLKALSVSIDELPLPSKYSSLGRDVSAASTNLRAAYRKGKQCAEH